MTLLSVEPPIRTIIRSPPATENLSCSRHLTIPSAGMRLQLHVIHAESILQVAVPA